MLLLLYLCTHHQPLRHRHGSPELLKIDLSLQNGLLLGYAAPFDLQW